MLKDSIDSHKDVVLDDEPDEPGIAPTETLGCPGGVGSGS